MADVEVTYNNNTIKLYDSGTLIQHLVPCCRKSDMVAGMYDKVTGTFFTNAGSGTFLAGPSVN